MLKKLLLIAAVVCIAHPASAQSADTRIQEFCSALVHKDITSIYTRPVLKPFFTSETALSNFIVLMNIRMEQAGFHRFTVNSCTVRKITVNGSTTEGSLKITGEGPLFFLKSRLLLSTQWFNSDNRWYIKVPAVMSTDE